MLSKSIVKFTSYRVASRKLAIAGSLAPVRKTLVTLRIDRLVGAQFKHVRDVKVATNSAGRFHYSSGSLPRGTWRIRASVGAGRGYMTVIGAWTNFRIK